MLLSLHNINASIWGEEKQIFLTYYLCVVGVVEVMKGMQDLDVSPDVETLSNYILPVFPSIDAARQALKVIHKSVWGFLFVGLFGFFHVTSFHLCLFWFKVVWDFCCCFGLQDAGISVESEGFLCSEMRLVAVTDLAKLYTLRKYTLSYSV